MKRIILISMCAIAMAAMCNSCLLMDDMSRCTPPPRGMEHHRHLRAGMRPRHHHITTVLRRAGTIVADMVTITANLCHHTVKLNI